MYIILCWWSSAPHHPAAKRRGMIISHRLLPIYEQSAACSLSVCCMHLAKPSTCFVKRLCGGCVAVVSRRINADSLPGVSETHGRHGELLQTLETLQRWIWECAGWILAWWVLCCFTHWQKKNKIKIIVYRFRAGKHLPADFKKEESTATGHDRRRMAVS